MAHFGHANALRQAKKLGDYLIVGIHSDGMEACLLVWLVGGRGGGGEEKKEGNLQNALLYEPSSLYGIRPAILLHEIAVPSPSHSSTDLHTG